jgi:hypothetical protein
MRCSVCKTPALSKFVDASAELTAAALSRQAIDMGMDLSPERILTHRKHREEETPIGAGVAKRKSDFAVLVRERAVEQFTNGELDLADKDHAAGINAGLKAQALLDKREATNKKNTQADMLVALLGALRGEAPVALLEDPSVIPGEFEVVE